MDDETLFNIFDMIGRINVVMPVMRSSGGALEDPEFIAFSLKVVVLVGIGAILAYGPAQVDRFLRLVWSRRVSPFHNRDPPPPQPHCATHLS